MCRCPYTTARALNRVCQSAVAPVPHQRANSGWRSTRVGSRTSGKWFTSTVSVPGASAASRRSVTARRARHQASIEGYGSGCSSASSEPTIPCARARSSASARVLVPGGRKV